MRYALKVQYIGKNYLGSQIQFDQEDNEIKPTVQGELERAICTLLNGVRLESLHKERPVKTVFSGRTDRGVNSLGQVVHFDCDKDIVEEDILLGQTSNISSSTTSNLKFPGTSSIKI